MRNEVAHGFDLGFALRVVPPWFLARHFPGQVIAISLVVERGHAP
jgi:hypothetical protein